MAATQLLHVLEEASRYSPDHNSLILRVASATLGDASTLTPSAASDLRVQYDAQKAEAPWHLSCSNTSFHSYSMSSMCLTNL